MNTNKNDFKKLTLSLDGTRLPIGFADVEFSFPLYTLHPCLCVKDAKYGLIQPLSGRTVATIYEIALALHQGVKITYIETLFVEGSNNFLFRDNLKNLIDKRTQAKRENNPLLSQLYKLFVNTSYGKIAQGISPKNSYDIRNDGMKQLGTSIITQPYFASMITGTLRAALSSLLVAIDELNREGHDYLAISATTDGMLYRVTSKTNISFKDCLKPAYHKDITTSLEKGDDIFNIFKDVDPILYKKLQEFPVLRLLQHSRKVWGYDEFLEIKHAVNSVINIKTRGQIGAYNA